MRLEISETNLVECGGQRQEMMDYHGDPLGTN